MLAIWPPNDRVLEFAEELACGSALCVVSGHLLDIAPWVRRTGAPCLVDGFCVADAPTFSPEVTKGLDRMLFFGGHHSFLDTGEKEDAVHRLHAIAARPDAPTGPQIVNYLRGSGATDAKGIKRAAQWYLEILEGRRHFDRQRRVICIPRGSKPGPATSLILESADAVLRQLGHSGAGPSPRQSSRPRWLQGSRDPRPSP